MSTGDAARAAKRLISKYELLHQKLEPDEFAEKLHALLDDDEMGIQNGVIEKLRMCVNELRSAFYRGKVHILGISPKSDKSGDRGNAETQPPISSRTRSGSGKSDMEIYEERPQIVEKSIVGSTKSPSKQSLPVNSAGLKNNGSAQNISRSQKRPNPPRARVSQRSDCGSPVKSKKLTVSQPHCERPVSDRRITRQRDKGKILEIVTVVVGDEDETIKSTHRILKNAVQNDKRKKALATNKRHSVRELKDDDKPSRRKLRSTPSDENERIYEPVINYQVFSGHDPQSQLTQIDLTIRQQNFRLICDDVIPLVAEAARCKMIGYIRAARKFALHRITSRAAVPSIYSTEESMLASQSIPLRSVNFIKSVDKVSKEKATEIVKTGRAEKKRADLEAEISLGLRLPPHLADGRDNCDPGNTMTAVARQRRVRITLADLLMAIPKSQHRARHEILLRAGAESLKRTAKV